MHVLLMSHSKMSHILFLFDFFNCRIVELNATHPSAFYDMMVSTKRCGPCRLTIPVVKEVMKQYSGELDVVEVNTDDLMEVAEKSGVLSIPTIQFYYNGIALETHSLVGCVAKSVLSNAIDKVIEDVAQMKKSYN